MTRGLHLDLLPDGERLDADRRVGAADLDAALGRAGTQVQPR